MLNKVMASALKTRHVVLWEGLREGFDTIGSGKASLRKRCFNWDPKNKLMWWRAEGKEFEREGPACENYVGRGYERSQCGYNREEEGSWLEMSAGGQLCVVLGHVQGFGLYLDNWGQPRKDFKQEVAWLGFNFNQIIWAMRRERDWMRTRTEASSSVWVIAAGSMSQNTDDLLKCLVNRSVSVLCGLVALG